MTNLFQDKKSDLDENIVIDYESIPVLPEPDQPILLREMNVREIADRLTRELSNGNWLYLEFEDALRMTKSQREGLLWYTGYHLQSFLGKPIDDNTIKEITGSVRECLLLLAEHELTPGDFGKDLAGALAKARLKGKKQE